LIYQGLRFNPIIFNMLPNNILSNCNNKKKSLECNFFMHEDCPETCKYAKDILGTKPAKTDYERFRERQIDPSKLFIGSLIK